MMRDAHDCTFCALHKKYLGIKTTSQETEAFVYIQSMLSNTEQAVKPGALETLKEKITNFAEFYGYYTAALDKRAEAEKDFKMWFLEARKKYNLPDEAKFDFNKEEFYECCDDKDVPSKSGNFIEKEDR